MPDGGQFGALQSRVPRLPHFNPEDLLKDRAPSIWTPLQLHTEHMHRRGIGHNII